MNELSYEINNISILSVLDKLWLEYKKTGMNKYNIAWSDGWIANPEANKVNDFSWKDRPKWPPFAFVKSYLKLNDAETYKWFVEAYNLHPYQRKMTVIAERPKTQKKYKTEYEIKKIWNELPDLKKEHIEYLSSRCIEYTKIRDVVKLFKNWIWCLVYQNWKIAWINARLIQGDIRFVALQGWTWKWIYMHNLDPNIPELFVVEGLMDFLSLRQYTTNVVWLRSASDWIEEIKELSTQYQIIFIPDNDEAGQSAMQKFFDMWIRFSYVPLPEDAKDVNSFLCNISNETDIVWEDLLEYLKQEAIDSISMLPEFQEISPYTWGLSSIDNTFWKFYPWDFIVLVWESWHWKTEFALFQAIENAKAWNKVCFISLEMTPGDLLKRLCMKRAWITVEEDNTKKIPQEKIEKYAECKYNLLNNKNISFFWLENRTVDSVLGYIREKAKQWYNLFYLDNFGFVTSDKNQNEIELLTELSRELKKIATELKIVVVWLHHFNKWTQKQRNTYRGLAAIRGSGKIENDADYIIVVYRDTADVEDINDDNEAKVIVAKNRRIWRVWSIDVVFEGWIYHEVD